jgi:hypothetical protein
MRKTWVLIASVVLVTTLPAPAVSAATNINVDPASGGRTFDGIGAISGGGGNSRLLFDYPEPQREHSHMHSRSDLNCDRGYEWWLMEQAKVRNPKIKLAALAWGAPGWVGGAGHTFWTEDNIDYHVKWLDCATSRGLKIDYLGGWNEKGFDKAWFVKFHAALRANNYDAKVVGDDGNKGWLVADAMVADPEFAKSVDVLGIHYSCGYQGVDKGKTCLDSANARGTGKPLWASETGSQDYQTGAFASTRSFNRGYIDARMTGYFNWPLIAAITPNLRWSTTGLLLANQPWSGAYTVGKQIWAIAHTTQFTKPGWRYLDTGSGFLGGNRDHGSYVSLRSGTDYSTIVETIDATTAQTLNMNVASGLAQTAVRVYATNLRSDNPKDHFVRLTDITPKSGKYSLTVQPGYVYSITTTAGQGKGAAAGPAGHPLALPYQDGFDASPTGKQPRYLADMDGAFEVGPCAGGRTGKCVRQVMAEAPIVWRNGKRDPSALLGDVSWRDYTVRTDVLLEQKGYVQLAGRVGTQGVSPDRVNAYFLRVTDGGAWTVLKSDTTPTLTTLAKGTVAALGTGKWHALSLAFKGSSIKASINGVTVGSVTDAGYAAGQVGVAVSQTVNAQFDNLSIS